MANSAWLQALSHRPELWYENMTDNYPAELSRMYTGLRTLANDGSVYGFFLQLKDLFEGMIRWYALTGIAYAEHLEKKELPALLCDPERSLSFGDWVNTVPQKLTADLQLAESPLGKLLKELSKQYNKGKIVRWRNDTVGHGALQPDGSEEFQNSLETNLGFLTDCLKANAHLAQQITYSKNGDGELCCTADNVTFCLIPFIREVDGDIRLFDSLTDKQDLCLALSYRTGQRTTVRIPYLFGLRARYYGDTPITLNSAFDEEVYTERIEAALRFYHDTDRYWKQAHYMNWLTQCLQHHEKGVFLLQADSGTGKSTFSHYLDGFGGAALKKQGITCRAYYFSRMSYRTKQEFAVTLSDLFSQAPEDEDRLHSSSWPPLSLDTKPEQRGNEMAAFLKTFRAYHNRCYGRQKLLLILDGIDELVPGDTDLLHFVPDPALLDTGTYVLVTYRPEQAEATFQRDFVENFPFTERKAFQAGEENRVLLKKAVQESVLIGDRPPTADETDRVCTVLNDRFTGLPVIRAVLKDAQTADVMNSASSLLSFYTEYLRQFYGTERFAPVKTVLLTLALAYEPLSVRMISHLAAGAPPTVELLAIMRDITPLLQTVRDREGTKYILGHPDFGEQMRKESLKECRALVEAWREEISGELELPPSDYGLMTYIAGGMYLWSKDILQEQLLEPALANQIGTIAGRYSKTANTAGHLSRMVRLFSSAEQGMAELWKATGQVQYAVRALDATTACIPNLIQLEDRVGCERIEQVIQDLLAQMPAETDHQAEFATAFFSNYATRTVMAEKFGDMESAQACHEKAIDILFSHPEHIPTELQIPFIHNCGVSLLHTEPEKTLLLCDYQLAFPGCSPFERANALLLKGDALKAVSPPRQEEAGQCIREAVAIAEHERPRSSMDAEIYPHALIHLGEHLCHAEQDFEGAIDALTTVLDIYDTRYKFGELPDRFVAAQILSQIGSAYCGIDQRTGGAEQKAQGLWFCNQSISVYRKALEEHIRFRPASAEPIFLNAAFVYHYYKEYDTALALIDEVAQMQPAGDPLTPQVQARCTSVRQELTNDQLPTQ